MKTLRGVGNSLREAARQLLVGTFEAKETGFVRRAIRPGFVCLDVGASFGWYSVLLSRLCGPEGGVHAFEPVPATFGLLQRNLDLKAIRNFSANQTALDATPGRKEMYIPDINYDFVFQR